MRCRNGPRRGWLAGHGVDHCWAAATSTLRTHRYANLRRCSSVLAATLVSTVRLSLMPSAQHLRASALGVR